MNLRSVLNNKTVRVGLKSTAKDAVIEELLDILMETGKVKDRSEALRCIQERERKMSTGMKHGVAIPHGKTDAVSDLVACIGISDHDIEFASLDGEPCRIFIMTLSPSEKTGPHLQFLAEVSQLFKSDHRREALLKVKSSEEVLSIFFE